MKRISAILISYNTKDLLKKAIQSLLPQLDLNLDEFIVVDNCSTDGSAVMVQQEFPLIKLLAQDKNGGYAYGANRGANIASGKIFLITNSDVVFTPRALQNLMRKMESHPKIGVVCPELVDFNGELRQLTWQWRASLVGELLNKLFSPISLAGRPFLKRLIPKLQKQDRLVSGLSGASFIIRREIWETIQGFDENFQLYYEDSDLFERVRQAGYQLLFSPNIKVFHALGGSTQKNHLAKTYLIFLQSRLYYYRKHLPGLQHWFLKIFLRLKMSRSKAYRQGGAYQAWVDTILNEKEIIPLWKEMADTPAAQKSLIPEKQG